ncbi:MAG: AAA family ATPase [Candidatus Melainabacteria bacterium]|nr:AAA family ATPase [Candidatus Melainabacteria bacterium]
MKSIRIERPKGKEGMAFPFNIPAVKSIDQLDFHPDVTFFVGENGSGKSTILEAIAESFDLSGVGGAKNIKFSSRYDKSPLHQHLKCQKNYIRPQDKYFFRAESMHHMGNLLEKTWREPGSMLSKSDVFRRFGGESLHEMSHGESFLELFTTGFRGNGLYFLDEPEAALSATRLLSALVRIHDLVESQSQFVIATHSAILLAYPRSRIYLFNEDGHRQVNFEETEHFKITRDFLNNYPRRIQQLLRPTPLLDWLEESNTEDKKNED